MSVGVQREACRKMSQHARYGFDVHAVLQQLLRNAQHSERGPFLSEECPPPFDPPRPQGLRP